MVLPDPADPWPRRTEGSGASIAIRASMLREVGGMPCVPSGEDRALIERLRLIDARVRHDPRISVVVSGRIEGRAQGGMADTMRRRILKQDEFVDHRIEPAWAAFYRLRMKRRISLLWEKPSDVRLYQLARLLRDCAQGAHGCGWRLNTSAWHGQGSSGRLRFCHNDEFVL